jgi:ring-1,2-phenylacetyl-CoA epoxidase subunit PaaE
MFYNLIVKEIRRETPDSVSLYLEVPAAAQSLFSFKAGQYITFRTTLHGQELRRSYSLSSAPGDPYLRVGVKEVPNGAFSVWANRQLKVGDTLEAMPPQGNFTFPFEAGRARTLVFMAAGSGITPVMSLIKTARRTEPDTRLILLYGNKTPHDAMYLTEIEDNAAAAGGKFVWEALYSRIPGGRKLTPDTVEVFEGQFRDLLLADAFFICGPESMIFSLRDYLTSKGISSDKIKYELFTTPVSNAPKTAAPLENVTSEVTVIMDDTPYNFVLSGNGDSILDAAIAAGVDAPFSCKGAVCCTCKAKVKEGTVRMAMNYALDDSEVEAGYVLTCQSHPTSARVVIDYDVI